MAVHKAFLAAFSTAQQRAPSADGSHLLPGLRHLSRQDPGWGDRRKGILTIPNDCQLRFCRSLCNGPALSSDYRWPRSLWPLPPCSSLACSDPSFLWPRRGQATCQLHLGRPVPETPEFCASLITHGLHPHYTPITAPARWLLASSGAVPAGGGRPSQIAFRSVTVSEGALLSRTQATALFYSAIGGPDSLALRG